MAIYGNKNRRRFRGPPLKRLTSTSPEK